MQHENVIMERHKMRIEDVITITMGTPQFRIKESLLDSAPTYNFYGQQELENDLVGIELGGEEAKTISTLDDLSLIKGCLLYTSPSPRDRSLSRMPSSA